MTEENETVSWDRINKELNFLWREIEILEKRTIKLETMEKKLDHLSQFVEDHLNLCGDFLQSRLEQSIDDTKQPGNSTPKPPSESKPNSEGKDSSDYNLPPGIVLTTNQEAVLKLAKEGKSVKEVAVILNKNSGQVSNLFKRLKELKLLE